MKPDTNGYVIAALSEFDKSLNYVYFFDTRESLAGALFKSSICTLSYCIHYISHFHCLGQKKPVIEFPCEAGSIKFSPVKPNLFAVGTFDGPRIYDLRNIKYITYDIDLIKLITINE